MGDDEKQNVGNQLKEMGKEKVKATAKQKIKEFLLKLAPILLKILLGALVVSCLVAVGKVVVDLCQGIINSIVDVFTGDQTAIEIDDEKLDQLIAMIEETGIDIDDLELLRRN